MSELRKIFTPNQKLKDSTAFTLAVTEAALLMLLWMFSPFVFLPTQGETLRAFSDLWFQGLGTDLYVSFKLNVQAVAIASVISLTLSYSTVLPFMRPVVRFVASLRNLSMVGLTFFFLLVSSGGHMLKLEHLVFGIMVFFVTNMEDVMADIPKVKFDLARTLGLGEWEITWQVVILGQADKAFKTVRQNAAIGWMMLTMVEGISRTEGGIGTLLLNQNKHFHLAAVLAIQLVIFGMGMAQDWVLKKLRTFFCPWADLAVERK